MAIVVVVIIVIIITPSDWLSPLVGRSGATTPPVRLLGQSLLTTVALLSPSRASLRRARQLTQHAPVLIPTETVHSIG